MRNLRPRVLFKIILLSAFLLVGSQVAFAQAPGATPTPNPATLPPGSEAPNPNAPPQGQQISPTAPPSTQVPGQPTLQNQNPTTTPGSTSDQSIIQEPAAPNFPKVEQRPLPPIPNMTRLGVTSDNTLALSLDEAIKRALANNNDIEVARDDVRYAETQLRSLQGIYQPLFSITPQLDKRITPWDPLESTCRHASLSIL